MPQGQSGGNVGGYHKRNALMAMDMESSGHMSTPILEGAGETVEKRIYAVYELV